MKKKNCGSKMSGKGMMKGKGYGKPMKGKSQMKKTTARRK